jgi:hypothetical protein
MPMDRMQRETVKTICAVQSVARPAAHQPGRRCYVCDELAGRTFQLPKCRRAIVGECQIEVSLILLGEAEEAGIQMIAAAVPLQLLLGELGVSDFPRLDILPAAQRARRTTRMWTLSEAD